MYKTIPTCIFNFFYKKNAKLWFTKLSQEPNKQTSQEPLNKQHPTSRIVLLVVALSTLKGLP